jgi:hypothetical protein
VSSTSLLTADLQPETPASATRHSSAMFFILGPFRRRFRALW